MSQLNLNGLYNAGLITLGAVGISMASQKLLKDDLGVTRSSQRVLRLAVAVWRIGTCKISTEKGIRSGRTV